MAFSPASAAFNNEATPAALRRSQSFHVERGCDFPALGVPSLPGFDQNPCPGPSGNACLRKVWVWRRTPSPFLVPGQSPSPQFKRRLGETGRLRRSRRDRRKWPEVASSPTPPLERGRIGDAPRRACQKPLRLASPCTTPLLRPLPGSGSSSLTLRRSGVRPDLRPLSGMPIGMLGTTHPAELFQQGRTN
jgi:hypothetical protein